MAGIALRKPPVKLALTASIIFAASATAADSGIANAQDAEFGARAEVTARVARTTEEDASASGSQVDLSDRPHALEDVGEALRDAPGVRVTTSGGFGGFSGVALRGAQPDHTTVLLDTLPLNAPDSGAFDLSTLPALALNRIEIYRGGAPLWLGDGSIGGVVRFVPARAEENLASASFGYGAFGRLSLQATSAVTGTTDPHISWLSHVGFDRADNDYEYLDDNGTRFEPDDDRLLRQRNAQIDSGNGVLHGSVGLLGGTLSLVAAGYARTAGTPGPLAAPTFRTRQQLVRLLASAAYDSERFDADGERAHRLQLLASLSSQRNRFTDLQGELGLARPIASDDTWSRVYARAAGSYRVLPYLETTLVATLAEDGYDPEDPLAFSAPPRASERTTAAVGFEPRLYRTVGRVRLELRPSLRLEETRTRIHTYRTDERPLDIDGDVFGATYRIGALVAPAPYLTFAISAATGRRVPTMLELFGDRAFLLGNAQLRPETSRTLDVSAIVRGRAGAVRGSFELRGFALWINDMIRYERTPQFTAVPDNIASARMLGAEAALDGRLGRHLSLLATLTLMDSESQLGLALPLRPSWLATLRPALTFFPAFADRMTLFVETQHQSKVYLDDPNLTSLEGRTFVSVGGSMALWQRRLSLAVRLVNLFDELESDLLSRPLPGRYLLVTLTTTTRDL